MATRKVSDIDSARMDIRVEQGKGLKDPDLLLSRNLLGLLRPGGMRRGHRSRLFP